jgi:hypothetical protein
MGNPQENARRAARRRCSPLAHKVRRFGKSIVWRCSKAAAFSLYKHLDAELPKNEELNRLFAIHFATTLRGRPRALSELTKNPENLPKLLPQNELIANNLYSGTSSSLV